MPSFRRRSNSVSSVGGSSAGEATRPNSVSCTLKGQLQDEVRPLSRHEVREKNQDAVEWFRASHAINYHSRPREETEALLAAARDRRSRSGIVQRCPHPKVEKVNDLDVETVNAENAVPELTDEAPAPRPRSCIDPMLLWGAKPVAAAKERPPKPEREKRSHSICGEGVAVGENSFLARLRNMKRASTIE